MRKSCGIHVKQVMQLSGLIKYLHLCDKNFETTNRSFSKMEKKIAKEKVFYVRPSSFILSTRSPNFSSNFLIELKNRNVPSVSFAKVLQFISANPKSAHCKLATNSSDSFNRLGRFFVRSNFTRTPPPAFFRLLYRVSQSKYQNPRR